MLTISQPLSSAQAQKTFEGPVYMARGLCFKPRPGIGKYPDGPMAPGETYRLTITATNDEPKRRSTDSRRDERFR